MPRSCPSSRRNPFFTYTCWIFRAKNQIRLLLPPWVLFPRKCTSGNYKWAIETRWELAHIGGLVCDGSLEESQTRIKNVFSTYRNAIKFFEWMSKSNDEQGLIHSFNLHFSTTIDFDVHIVREPRFMANVVRKKNLTASFSSSYEATLQMWLYQTVSTPHFLVGRIIAESPKFMFVHLR